MMARSNRAGSNTLPVTAAEARAYLAQAQEYLRAAETSLAAGDHNAAAGTAVVAGINAADAVSGIVNGTRWAGEHSQAPVT